MNERLTSYSLAVLLAEETGMDIKRAQKFIDVLATYITSGINKYKSVKIIGLGTFKIVLVRERESVHIQTGERFIISAHHKLSFIPDKEFKITINKPFSIFESIETNNHIIEEEPEIYEEEVVETVTESSHIGYDDDDSYDLYDFEISRYTESQGKKESSVIEEDDPMVAEEEPVYTESTSYRQEKETSQSKEDKSYFTEDDEIEDEDVEDEDEIEEEIEEEVVVEEEDVEEENDDYEDELIPVGASSGEKTARKTVPWWIMFFLLPVFVLLGVGLGTYAFLMFNKPSETIIETDPGMIAFNPDEPAPIGAFPSDNDDEFVIDTVPQDVNDDTATFVPNDEPFKRDTPKIDWFPLDKPEVRQKKTETTQAQNTSEPDNTKIPARVRLGKGQTLTQIAAKYYGDRIFWVYLYEHNKNHIKDFDNIPVNTVIELPRPEQYDIDVKNPASIQRAKEKQAQLMKGSNWDDYK